MRIVTYIRKDDIMYCKRLSELDEIKHLEEINGNFGILDKADYHAPAVPMMMHISIKDFVDQHRYLFNILRNKDISSQPRIKGIEEGIVSVIINDISEPIKIKILHLNN